MVDCDRIRWGRPLSGVFVAVLAALAAGPAAAQVPLEFGVGMGSSWYDHRSAESGTTTYSRRSLEPYVAYIGPLGEWEVRGRAQHRFEFYSGDTLDSLLDGGDPSQDYLRLGAVRRVSELERVGLETGYTRSHDLLDPDRGTIVVDGEQSRWTGGAEAALRHFEGDTRMRATWYAERPGLADAFAFGIAARALPIQQPVYSVFAGGDYRLLGVDGKTVLDTRSASVGVRRLLAPLVRGEFSIGGTQARYEDGSRANRLLVGLGFERDPQRVAALGARLFTRFEGDSLASLEAEARYYSAAGRGWLRFESMADAEGGLTRGAVRTRRVALGAEDTLARANVLGLEASYARTNALQGDAPVVDVIRASAWAMRRVQPWLNARLGASFLREPVGWFGATGPLFRRIRLDAELIVVSSGFGFGPARSREPSRTGRAG